MLRVSLDPDTATAETTTLARAIDLVTGGIVELRSRVVVVLRGGEEGPNREAG
jgi:hypothetical protein